jgi:hypothetical protein
LFCFGGLPIRFRAREAILKRGKDITSEPWKVTRERLAIWHQLKKQKIWDLCGIDTATVQQWQDHRQFCMGLASFGYST